MSLIETMITFVEDIGNIGMTLEDWVEKKDLLKYTLLTKFYLVISGFFQYREIELMLELVC